jgi:hypothetical protein
MKRKADSKTASTFSSTELVERKISRRAPRQAERRYHVRRQRRLNFDSTEQNIWMAFLER